ncbi:MAG: ABC transporter permease subunit [Chitinivibrionales bacterium]|nr:ABC transporter permease subunit [Chitinivibrionales bacterium]
MKSRSVMTGVCLCAMLTIVYSSPDASEAFSVALTGKYPPFSFYSDSGTLTGFDVDVSAEIARRLDRRLEIITTEWDGILAGLLAGKFDAIIGSMAITPERRKKVSFSRPYYESGAQLFCLTKDTADIASIQDMYGEKVGVVIGETYEHYLRTNHPEINTVTYKSSVDIFQDMHNGRLKGFLTDRLVGMYQVKQAGMPFAPAGRLLYKEQMGIPTHQNATRLLERINAALEDMQQDGTFDRLTSKWFRRQTVESPASSAMQPEVIRNKLVQGFAVTIAIAGLSLVFGFLLALPIGVIINSNIALIGAVLRFGVDFIRGTPVLIQLFFIYFGAPQIGLTISPIVSAIVTLSINSAAYMAEVIRSGLMAVPPGQPTAGKALGLARFDIFFSIVWPQAFRIAMPTLVNSCIALLKDTALVSVISVAEVIRQAQSIISVTYNPIKYYLIVGVMFFVFTYPLMHIAARIERGLKRKGFVHD